MEGILFSLDLAAGCQSSQYLLSSVLFFYNIAWVWTGNILGAVDAAQHFQMWLEVRFLTMEGNSFKSAPGVEIKLIFERGVAPFCLSVLDFGNFSLCKSQNTHL